MVIILLSLLATVVLTSDSPATADQWMRAGHER